MTHLTGGCVATPAVPGDEILALTDHRHLDHVARPLVTRHPLSLGQDLLADPTTLQSRSDGECAEVGAARAASLDSAARDHRAALVACQRQAAVARRDHRRDRLRIGALPAELLGLRRPPCGAALTPVSGLHKINHQRHVVGGGGTKRGQRHGDIVPAAHGPAGSPRLADDLGSRMIVAATESAREVTLSQRFQTVRNPAGKLSHPCVRLPLSGSPFAVSEIRNTYFADRKRGPAWLRQCRPLARLIVRWASSQSCVTRIRSCCPTAPDGPGCRPAPRSGCSAPSRAPALSLGAPTGRFGPVPAWCSSAPALSGARLWWQWPSRP